MPHHLIHSFQRVLVSLIIATALILDPLTAASPANAATWPNGFTSETVIAGLSYLSRFEADPAYGYNRAKANSEVVLLGTIEFRKKNAKLHMQKSLVLSMIRAYLPLHYLCEAQ